MEDLFSHVYLSLLLCTSDVKKCLEGLCKNGGQCVNSTSSGLPCRCPAGFRGNLCQTGKVQFVFLKPLIVFVNRFGLRKFKKEKNLVQAIDRASLKSCISVNKKILLFHLATQLWGTGAIRDFFVLYTLYTQRQNKLDSPLK